MKIHKNIAITSLCLVLSFNATAQLLKKLKKQVENAVEETIVDKTEELARKTTSEAFDKVIDIPTTPSADVSMKDYMGSIEDLPTHYNFNWKYTMSFKFKRKKDNIDMTFYLKEDANYWGAEFKGDTEVFMVYDNERNVMPMFMNDKGTKMVTVTKLNVLDNAHNTLEELNKHMSNFDIEEIPGKTILGYQCKGYLVTYESFTYTMYLTFDVEIGFSDIYTRSNQIPENFNLNWLTQDNKEGVLMEMTIKDSKNKKNNLTMVCTALEEKSLSIKPSDYKSY